MRVFANVYACLQEGGRGEKSPKFRLRRMWMPPIGFSKCYWFIWQAIYSFIFLTKQKWLWKYIFDYLFFFHSKTEPFSIHLYWLRYGTAILINTYRMHIQGLANPMICKLPWNAENKTVTTVTAIKAARNCLSLEKTNTFNCQNLSIITFTY